MEAYILKGTRDKIVHHESGIYSEDKLPLSYIIEDLILVLPIAVIRLVVK